MNEFLKEERVLPKGILKNNCQYIDSVVLYEDHGGSHFNNIFNPISISPKPLPDFLAG